VTTRRPALHLLGLAALLAVALAMALRLGAVPLPVGEVLRALAGAGDPDTVAIIRHLRLPRAVQSALVGGALALSGAVFQALLQNPLADPFVLGVSSGAAVGAVFVVVLGLSAFGVWTVAIAAFAGGLAAIALVLQIALAAGRAMDGRVLVLAGVMVSALANATILLVLTFADPESFRSALFWLMGSNGGATTGGVALLGSVLALGSLIFVGLSRPLNLFSIGDQTAAVLGVRVGATKLVAFATASLLTAVAVAVSGVIGFVGLVIPHAARIAWGSDHRTLLPASVLLGAAFLTVADAVARTAAAPVELPIGAITALIGVPFFLWLLSHRSRKGAAA
jgi:ABC-type Fe3+-siderophore transport system permease subunit